MPDRIVDARGQLCPKPLIMTKKAMLESRAGDRITVQLDNATAVENVTRFLTDNAVTVESSSQGTQTSLRFLAPSAALSRPDTAAYCGPAPLARPHVIAIKSDTMGHGDEQLGSILIKALVNTIENVTPLPSAIVFYNRGVFLAIEGSGVLDALTELSGKGVRILACGTCLDFYKVKDKLRVGIVSNMYDILETLSAAGHVIYP